ncbi:PEGA domain-containing protein [Desulfoluna sp.]|uniref:PEGA domain-containing protein n=1 Tax=Desulfoluna sp. TaxID=2045199 RepID=UPI0026345C65|nr:PEGA domain-containing protein [Desulfoluna sp.]
MKKKFRTFTVVVFGVFILMSWGCATVVKGPNEKIGISSSPIGANVTVNGMTYTTPVIVELPRKKSHIVVFEKEGYESASGTLQSEMSAWWAWNFIFGYGAILGIPIDIATGSSKNLTPDNVHVTMQRNIELSARK